MGQLFRQNQVPLKRKALITSILTYNLAKVDTKNQAIFGIVSIHVLIKVVFICPYKVLRAKKILEHTKKNPVCIYHKY